MWELYKTLKNGIDDEQDLLIDAVFEMLDRVSKEDFLQALWMMYPKIDFTKHNPVEMATLFVAGLKKNNFFSFVEIIQGLSDGDPRR
jgi:hypothetical protein